MSINFSSTLFGNCVDFLNCFNSNEIFLHGDALNRDYLATCAVDIPSAVELFADLTWPFIIVGVLLSLFTLIIWVIYIEEIYFIAKKFKISARRGKTIWVLAFAPVFSTTGLLGAFLPRSGPLVDMVANVFFGSCLYNFGGLMVNYMGGHQKMWEIVSGRQLELNTPPLCCCCICLPKKPFTRRVSMAITAQIMQVAIVRTLLMFVAAVLWADGIYSPGDTSFKNGFIYITFLNLISTMTAVYGLMLTRRVLAPELQKKFAITGKIATLQLTLLSSVIPNFIIGLLVSNDVIGCGAFLPRRGRGEVLYHTILVVLMLPYSLMGRKFYRRLSDGQGYAENMSLKCRPIQVDGSSLYP